LTFTSKNIVHHHKFDVNIKNHTFVLSTTFLEPSPTSSLAAQSEAEILRIKEAAPEEKSEDDQEELPAEKLKGRRYSDHRGSDHMQNVV
jgi:hypothetical protein